MDHKRPEPDDREEFIPSEEIRKSIEQALEKLEKAREEFRRATGESTSGAEETPAKDKPNENPKP